VTEKAGPWPAGSEGTPAGVDELNAQIVSLRRVAQAEELSRHLAKKMAEISERLLKATIEVTDLEARQMTQRIALQNRVAELTL
jgi:hypothetical protein